MESDEWILKKTCKFLQSTCLGSGKEELFSSGKEKKVLQPAWKIEKILKVQ